MRRLAAMAMVMTACGGSRAGVPDTTPVGEPSGPQVPSSNLHARIGFGLEDPFPSQWEEVTVQGTDAAARRACEGYVTNLQERWPKDSDVLMKVLVPCGPYELNPQAAPAGSTLRLVTTSELPLDFLTLTEGEEPPSGQLVRLETFEDQATCERRRSRYADELRARRDSSLQFLEGEAGRAEERAIAKCKQVPVLDGSATPLVMEQARFALQQCELEREVKETIERRVAEEKAKPLPEPPPCEPLR